jgi:hypothetical protein
MHMSDAVLLTTLAALFAMESMSLQETLLQTATLDPSIEEVSHIRIVPDEKEQTEPDMHSSRRRSIA